MKHFMTLKTNLTSRNLVFLALLPFIAAATSCINPEVKFKKAMLLDPLMDPAKDRGFQDSVLAEPGKKLEHGNGSGTSGSGATCPTCGG